jgi:hypothetical protein
MTEFFNEIQGKIFYRSIPCMWTAISFPSDLYLQHKNIEANEENRKDENWKTYLGQIKIDIYISYDSV